MMRQFVCLSIFFIVLSSYGQDLQIPKLGQATIDELKMSQYEKDSLAKAVVLQEKGFVYLDERNDYDFRRDVYRRVKIFDKSEFDRATITIRTYKDEKVKYIKAITYNLKGELVQKMHLLPSKVFRNKIYENWYETVFTLPNIQEGCVIEYKYSLISPYSRIRDWYFQSHIPKVKSDFSVSIPGNWKYNIRIRSGGNVDRKDSYVKKDCIQIPGLGRGHCAVVSYGRDEIQAFKNEDFMLTEDNYISKLMFELISFTSPNGATTRYTQTWKDADKTFRKNFFDSQTSKKNYFKKILPQSLFAISDDLERAQNVYEHIQQKLSWNDKYWTTKKLKVKDVYTQESGSVDGINLTLYNALQAAGIESYLVALSTRNNGIVTKLHPSVDDFNYVIVKVVVNEESYFLDATDKFLLFGEVPYRCLNGEGRVLDFKKGSYWELIKAKKSSFIRHSIMIGFDEATEMKGQILIAEQGYNALKTRKKIAAKSKDEFLDDFETEHPFLEVEDFRYSNDKGEIKSTYSFVASDIEEGNTIKFNPFLVNRSVENPFKLNERTYPVDFGHATSESYSINIDIPEGYVVSKMPESKGISLPEKGGRAVMRVGQTGNQLKIYMKYSFSRAVYTKEEYYYLKEYYKQIIEMQDAIIELSKKS